MKIMRKMVCALLAMVMVAGVCVIPTQARSDNAKVKVVQEAIDNAENGTTITLTEDLSWGDGEPIEIPAGKNITIDLNGYRIESLEPYPIFRVMSGAEVIIKASVDTSIAKNTGMPEEYQEYYDAETMGLFEVQENAKLTIETGDYEAGDNYFTGNTKGEVILEGGYYNKVPEGTYSVKTGYEFVSAVRKGVDVWCLSNKTQETLDTEVQRLVLYLSAGKNVDSLIDKETKENIYEANGGITAELVVKEMQENEIATSDKTAIDGKVDTELGTDVAVQYINVSVVLKGKDDGKELGTLNSLSEDITITVSIPDDLKEDGRRYKVVRTYNGATDVLDTIENDDGTISFETNVSSTCALAYVGKITFVEDAKTEATINKETQNLIENITEAVAKSVVDEKTAEKVSEAISSGKTVSTEIVVTKLLQNDITQTEQSAIEEKVSSELGTNAKVQYLDVSIVLMAGDEELGTLNKIEDEITITVAIPEELKAEGRIYKVIRNHDGEITVLDTVENEDGTISFKTDRFSTYALAYADSETPNTTPSVTPNTTPSTTPVVQPTTSTTNTPAPQTGDNTSAMVYGIMCIIALAVVVLWRKRSTLA